MILGWSALPAAESVRPKMDFYRIRPHENRWSRHLDCIGCYHGTGLWGRACVWTGLDGDSTWDGPVDGPVGLCIDVFATRESGNNGWFPQMSKRYTL